MKNVYSLLSVLIVAIFMFVSCSSETKTQDDSTSNSDMNTEDAAFAKANGQSGITDADSQKNILQVAVGSKDHTTLVTACKAAGIVDILVNAGPITVFAPTNAAFDALPKGTLETLLKPENKKQLARIVRFHASPGKYYGKLFKNGMKLYQATGHYVDVEIKGKDVYIAGAKILGTIQCSNGVVHVIDKVMLPPEKK